MDLAHLPATLEALLFASAQPLSVAEAKQLLETAYRLPEEVAFDEAAIQLALEALAERLAESGSAVELRNIGGGYQLYTRPQYADLLRSVIVQREQRKLSKTVLETLAIIAYQQPVAKSQLDYIRGVDTNYALQKLLDRNLIQPAGRADTPGRPLLYRTTSVFMEHFGLASLEDLPRTQELKVEEEKVDEAYKNNAREDGADPFGPSDDSDSLADENLPAAAPESAASTVENV